MMKPKHSKITEHAQRDSMPFLRCSSAVEILDSGLVLRTNRDSNPSKNKLPDKPAPFRLDTLLGHQPQGNHSSLFARQAPREPYKQYHSHTPVTLAPDLKKRSSHASKQILHPTLTPNLNQNDDENNKVVAKMLRQTKNEMAEFDSKVKQELIGVRNVMGDLRRQLEEMEKRTQQQGKKHYETCANIKEEYRRAFTLLVEQINNKFISTDRKILGFEEQTMVLKSSLDLFKEEVNKKVEDLNIGHLNLLTRMNNDVKIDDFQQQQYQVDLSSSISQAVIDVQQSDLRQQLQCMFEQIKSMKTQLSKVNSTNPNNTTRTSNTTDHTEQLEALRGQLMESMVKESEQTSRILEPKLAEFEKLYMQMTDNIAKVNHEFQRVINQHIYPRIAKLEDGAKVDEPKKQVDELTKLKNQLEERLKTSKILCIRRTKANQTKAIDLVKEINLPETYFLDQERYLLDSQGTYLTDQSDKRIQLQQDQLYFLSQQGMNIMPLP